MGALHGNKGGEEEKRGAEGTGADGRRVGYVKCKSQLLEADHIVMQMDAALTGYIQVQERRVCRAMKTMNSRFSFSTVSHQPTKGRWKDVT